MQRMESQMEADRAQYALTLQHVTARLNVLESHHWNKDWCHGDITISYGHTATKSSGASWTSVCSCRAFKVNSGLHAIRVQVVLTTTRYMIGLSSCEGLTASATDAAVFNSPSVALWDPRGTWWPNQTSCGAFAAGTHIVTMLLNTNTRTVTMTADSGATTGPKPVPAGDLYIMFTPAHLNDSATLL
eukprot:TRINITY_DN9960_c0_g2_i1.p1 TRINITY_DN9960_c0_g2~~TRINITY_DN9960_c0_g2_i1.p1  ORF type:complete len:187 (-),score=30.82 TRINITY_DN9960_c0_g2_i1:24-584(-)